MTEHASLRLQLSDEAVSTPLSLIPEPLCAPAAPTEAQDLVDSPCHTLETAFKSWRNLDNPEDQAEIARDVAAIANAGGGHIVFGFDEDQLLPTDTEPFATNCTPDRVNRIVNAYLDPPPNCQVIVVRSALGDLHPVIRIPGHGPTPVCARKDGPAINHARIIERGGVYIRRHAQPRSLLQPPHAETVRAECAQDWAQVIRRCVRLEREAFIEQIEAILEPRRPTPQVRDKLLAWHHAARNAFLALTPRSTASERLARAHYTLSYAIVPQRHLLEPAQLPEFLRRCAFELQSRFGSGPRYFEPPTRIAVRPRYVSDPATGDTDIDFLETAWLRAYPPSPIVDLWRVSPNGMASIIRDYAEDRPDAVPPEHLPGPWLSPIRLSRNIAELVWHARFFARFFPSPTNISFRCDWWGLDGRIIFDSNEDDRWVRSGAAQGDHRCATLDLPLAGFDRTWPEAVARLMAPVIRAMEPDLSLGPDWVLSQATK